MNELEQERVRLTKQVESQAATIERLTDDGLEIGNKLLAVSLEKVAIENERDSLRERIEKLENELRRMTAAFESIAQTACDMQNPAKRAGPTHEPQVLQVQKEQELSE